MSQYFPGGLPDAGPHTRNPNIPTMTTHPDRRVWLAAALIIALTTPPYLAGLIAAPAGTHFGGVILHPLDYESHPANIHHASPASCLSTSLLPPVPPPP